MSDIVTRQIAGHTYSIIPLDPTKGRRVMFRILALLGPGAGTLIESILGAQELTGALLGVLLAKSADDRSAARRDLAEAPIPEGLATDGRKLREALLELDLSAALASLRIGGIGGDLATAARRLAMEDDDLVSELIATASRDGLPLANQVHYAQAYRSNYWELLAALGAILDANGLFTLPSTSSGASGR